MLKQYHKRELKKAIAEKLSQNFGTSINNADKNKIYNACALYIQDELKKIMLENEKNNGKKRKVHYICMEFLLGRSLKNHAYNLGMLDELEEAINELGYDIKDIFCVEKDAGIGYASIGQLAACYGDAISTIGINGVAYTIRYENGNFIQKIENGEQIELKDPWLETGSVWQQPDFESAQTIHIGGHIEENWEYNHLNIYYRDDIPVIAVPYDIYISGYKSDCVTKLRLWQAESPLTVDLNSENHDFILNKIECARAISHSLYSDNSTPEDKLNRLKQQYFLVSATVQDICSKHKKIYGTLENFAEKNVLHLNDTAPTMAIPELMRILLDEEKMSWNVAWNITTQSIAYTNHSMTNENSEFWSIQIMQNCVPRIMMIINEIDRRFCEMLYNYYPNEPEKINKIRIISNNYVCMANLAVVGSFSVNGVSDMHEKVLKTQIFPELYAIYPSKFRQVANGISIRRWLCQANSELTHLIKSKIGDGFITHPSELHVLAGLGNDKTLLEDIANVKLKNKKRLAEYIHETTGINVDINTMFDTYCKHIKFSNRHIMFLMHIITIYNKIKRKKEPLIVPRTFIMCAKAMPNQKLEKKIIKLTHSIAQMINNDNEVNKFIKVVFLENYNVSLAEIIVPATDLSEQISITGSKSSSTGNMKFMMNGAITIGTWDSTNIEIKKAVGCENIFLFGTQPNQAFTDRLRPQDSNYELYPEFKLAVETIKKGFNDGVNYNDVLNNALKNNTETDYFKIEREFASYCRAQERASQMYLRQQNWNYMSLINIANSGRFASDRSVAEYAQNIWRVPSKFLL